MSDEIGAPPAVESPCINICVVHRETRLCTGCYRSIEEITAWSRMSPEARAAVMADLPGRASAFRVRRGGRAGRRARDAGTV